MPDTRAWLRVAAMLAAMLCAPRSTSAQVQLQGLGGATNAAERAPFFAGVLGFKISFVEIDLEGGRLQNVMPKGVLDEIYRLERERGLPLQAFVRVPATYGAGSVRLIVPAGVVQPFISGGLGIARLQPRLDVAINGVNLSDVLGGRIIGAQTNTMAIAGAGVRLDFHAVNIEGGYRYYAIFGHFERTTDFSRDRVLTSLQAIYGALAFRF